MLKIFKRERPPQPVAVEPAAVEELPSADDASRALAATSVDAAEDHAPSMSSQVVADATSKAPVAAPVNAPPSQAATTADKISDFLKSSTSADFDPLSGIMGLDQARDALRALRRLEPRSAVFVVSPRTSAHTEVLRTLLAEEAGALPRRDAVAVVARFEGSGGLDVLRMPQAEAAALSEGVAATITMLSATIPAAFESDSYRVARIALDEELRSGHDGALDALRRKAQAQNIGLLRTTNGYAVVPMHDGRVVRGEIYGALPGSLKSDVEAKLAQFEAELADVLKQRALLQQDHHRRAKELERDAASLAVDAAMGPMLGRYPDRPDVVSWLATLRSDLIANAMLFVAAAREANGTQRAPVEIALDPRFQRYRVNVLSRGGRGQAGLELPETLDRAELLGVLQNSAPGIICPDGVIPGSLTHPGGGMVVVDVRDLMANYGSWPLIKHALKSARAAPLAVGEGGVQRAAALDLPVEVRLVVTGEPDEYASWCRLDPDVARLLRVISAFPPHLAATAAAERTVARHLAGFVRDDGLLPFDGPALAAVIGALKSKRDDHWMISADLDSARDLMAAASTEAASAGRVMVLTEDVAEARRSRPLLAAAMSGTSP